MAWPKWSLAVMVAVGGVAFWLLLAGPDRILGIDSGNLGVGLASLVAWGSLYGVGWSPRGPLDEAVSPGEWRAWVGFGFTGLVAVFLLAKADVIAGATDLRDLGPIGRNIVLLLVAWAVLSWHLQQRWKGQVLEDERDREIAVLAAGWGRGATALVVIGVIVLLGFTPAPRLEWATPIAIAHLLIFALVWGSLAEHAVAGISYWRDRRP
jgi:hypothetical protein